MFLSSSAPTTIFLFLFFPAFCSQTPVLPPICDTPFAHLATIPNSVHSSVIEGVRIFEFFFFQRFRLLFDLICYWDLTRDTTLRTRSPTLPLPHSPPPTSPPVPSSLSPKAASLSALSRVPPKNQRFPSVATTIRRFFSSVISRVSLSQFLSIFSLYSLFGHNAARGFLRPHPTADFSRRNQPSRKLTVFPPRPGSPHCASIESLRKTTHTLRATQKILFFDCCQSRDSNPDLVCLSYLLHVDAAIAHTQVSHNLVPRSASTLLGSRLTFWFRI